MFIVQQGCLHFYMDYVIAIIMSIRVFAGQQAEKKWYWRGESVDD